LIKLLSGNEAFARGAWEAGVTVASAYPGTPSTEILEAVVNYKQDIYCEWAPNEKVAFEVGAAAAMAGARSIVTMKHVGLNVAADPLMTLAYLGVKGGFVAVVADDPGMHSSQNEQDTRNYAKFAKIPIFEPSSSQEAKDVIGYALDISEKYETPVIVRSTTRVSHSRSLVECGPRREPNEVGFEKDPPRWVPVPLWARPMRVKVEERLQKLRQAASASEWNRIEIRDTKLGIIAAGITYQYVREVWPEASVLKLTFSYPFPDDLIREFAAKVDNILVVEELDDLLEQHILAMGIDCAGRDYVPGIGELSPTRLAQVRAAYEETQAPQNTFEPDTDLPGRPPVLCAGCPHRGVFYALAREKVVVTGDIGCYSLGTFKPLNALDIILCMGGGISMAHGIDKAKNPKPVVGIVGDSTFFHSGITGLLNIGYNKGNSTLIVADNRTTAMTGHQDHPGTGKTLMGEPTIEASIAEFGKACGIKRIRELNPYDLPEAMKIVKEEIAADEPSLIISKGPCVLKEKLAIGGIHEVIEENCKECGMCLKLGCPAIEGGSGKPKVNPLLCVGCNMCGQVCKFNAIVSREDS
jgi:indolepyruvate ferredoxin oxidoreductase, alpha subunit